MIWPDDDPTDTKASDAPEDYDDGWHESDEMTALGYSLDAADAADRTHDEDASSDRDAPVLPADLTDEWDIIF